MKSSSKANKALEEAANLIGNGLRARFGKQTIICTGRNSPEMTEFFERRGGVRVVQLQSETVGEKKAPISEELNNLQHILKDPPRRFAEALHEVDPNAEGLIYAGSFVEEGTCLGRPVIGARKTGWFNSEDKERQIAWTDGQTEFQQDWIVSSSADDLESACRNLNGGLIIVSGAPRKGLAMGGSHTFAIPVADNTLSSKSKGILERLVEACRGVRVSRQTVGRPVTYYGYVAQGHHLAFGPVEALAFWNQSSYRIEALGILTPCPDGGSRLQPYPEIETILRRVAEACGYCGGFCIDGSIGQKGLVIHEINPRVCAGFTLLNKHVDGVLPANMIDMALREALVDDTSLLFERLDTAFSDTFCQPNLALWSDTALEQELLALVPDSPTAEDIRHWRDEVVKRFSEQGLVPLALAHFRPGSYSSP